MSDTDYLTDVFSQAGPGFSAGCRLLEARYGIGLNVSVMIAASVTATAIGPAPRIRNPWGTDLPLSFDFFFCADSQSTVSAAISDGFRAFRDKVSGKLHWRDAAGSRQLRLKYVETLDIVERVQQSLLVVDDQPEDIHQIHSPTVEEEIAQKTLKKQSLLQRQEALLQQLAECRMDMLPFILGEGVGLDTITAVDKISFDRCFTTISSKGELLREVKGLTRKQGKKFFSLLQASRYGRAYCDGSSVVIDPMLVLLQVVTSELLVSAFNNPVIQASGFLDGLIVEVPNISPAINVDAFLASDDEAEWNNHLSRLFTIRSRGVSKIYMLNRTGVDYLEDFRQWCTQSVGCLAGDLITAWSALVLKLSLCFHLASGQCEETRVSPALVKCAADFVKSVGAEHAKLVERLTCEPSAKDVLDAEVTRMVGKLRTLGGTASMRDLFRCYSHQSYSTLEPVLNQAVAEGRIVQKGRDLHLPAKAVRTEHPSASARHT